MWVVEALRSRVLANVGQVSTRTEPSLDEKMARGMVE
jgi:hypothetical protein